MQVYISEAPAPNPPAQLRGRFSKGKGTFALLIGATEKSLSKRTRKTISIPFFHCLGKNLATVGSYTAQTSDFRDYIQHWFAAYDAQHLVVFDAETLSPGTMTGLFEYAAPVPAVTFVSEPRRAEHTKAALTAAGVESTPLPWQDLLTRLPQVEKQRPGLAPTYDMDHLPAVDFLLFRHTARALNDARRFDAIDADYRAAYNTALGVDLNLGTVVTMLAQLTRTATTTAPLLVALRATQAALLTRGWLLAAHQDRAIGTLCAIRPPNPTNDHWNALHGYVRTPRVAGVALYLLDVPPDDLNHLTVGDVSGFLTEGNVRGRPIPELARPLLRAHLCLRRSQGALDTDPYLNQKGTRRHLEDLIEARRHLGIPIDGHNLHGTLAHTERPLWRFGLDLRPLT